MKIAKSKRKSPSAKTIKNQPYKKTEAWFLLSQATAREKQLPPSARPCAPLDRGYKVFVLAIYEGKKIRRIHCRGKISSSPNH